MKKREKRQKIEAVQGKMLESVKGGSGWQIINGDSGPSDPDDPNGGT